jgi:hypothetical protein
MEILYLFTLSNSNRVNNAKRIPEPIVPVRTGFIIIYVDAVSTTFSLKKVKPNSGEAAARAIKIHESPDLKILRISTRMEKRKLI